MEDELTKLRRVVSEAAVELYEALESGEGMNLPSMIQCTEESLRYTCEELGIPMLTIDYEKEEDILDSLKTFFGPQWTDVAYSGKVNWPQKEIPRLKPQG